MIIHDNPMIFTWYYFRITMFLVIYVNQYVNISSSMKQKRKKLGVHLFGLIHVPIIFAKQHHFWLKAPFPWPHLNLHAEIHIILVKISLLLVDNCFTGKLPIVWFDSQSFLLESRCANCLTTSFSG